MLKHIEDDAELAFLINDDGAVLVVCQECKKQWVLQIGDVSDAARPDVEFAPRNLQHLIKTSLAEHPNVLTELSIELSDLR
jgi:hypothetical protein